MRKTLALSVIIPTLNEEHYLPRVLQSLFDAAYAPLQIIVVDGQSTDRTVEVVRALESTTPQGVSLRLIQSDVQNVSAQRNLGAQHASHELLLFLDADAIVPSPEHLHELVARFTAEHCVAASCRFEPVEHDWRGRAYFSFLYGFHKTMERWHPYGMGACIMTTRDTFARLGGFDPGIRVNEDADFCNRAKKIGTFRVLPVTLKVSTRRFAKHGYTRMGLRYLQIFAYRTLHGEIRGDRIPYEFGKYD